MINTVKQIVEAMGGRQAVAKRLKITPQAVSNAVRRDVLPGRWHIPVFKTLGNKVNPQMYEADK